MRIEKARLRHDEKREQRRELFSVTVRPAHREPRRGRGEVDKCDDLRIPVELVIHPVYPAEHEHIAQKLTERLRRFTRLGGAHEHRHKKQQRRRQIRRVDTRRTALIERQRVAVFHEGAVHTHACAEEENVHTPQEIEKVVPRLGKPDPGVKKQYAQDAKAHNVPAPPAYAGHIVEYPHRSINPATRTPRARRQTHPQLRW